MVYGKCKTQDQCVHPGPAQATRVFWRFTTGDVNWGFKYTAQGALFIGDEEDSAGSEGGLELYRCQASGVNAACSSQYGIHNNRNVRVSYAASGTDVTIDEVNIFYREFKSQTGNYRYFGAPYVFGSAHSTSNNAAAADFGQSDSSPKFFQVHYVYREMQ